MQYVDGFVLPVPRKHLKLYRSIALGLILPGLLRKRPSLTPLAAACLLILMIGAVAITIAGDGVAAGIAPLIVGALCAFVAYGRSRLLPHGGG